MSSKPPQTLTQDEVSGLLVYLKTPTSYRTTTYEHERNYLMALLMVDAGLRVGELVGLKTSELLINHKPVAAVWLKAEVTKNHLERLVPLSDRVQNQILTMHGSFWQDHPFKNSPFAFPSWKTTTHISARQVERIIKGAGLHAIGRDVHPHILRHTFATRMMRVTNIRVVQQLLGHKRLSSTQIYTHPTNDDLRAAIEAAQT